MATVLLTEPRNEQCIRSRPRLLRHRLSARVRSRSLDAALARGVSPDSSAALSLRANKLIGPGIREPLARELAALVKQARGPRHLRDPRVPICRRAVLDAAEVLAELGDRLLAPIPVEAQGVAALLILLREGSSPLFNPACAERFADELEAALDALEPRLEF